jgi:hypothetical protein
MTVKSPLDDRRVQALLNKFMSGSIDTLTPIFDLKRGFVYPDVEEIIGESEDAEKFLAMLVEAGILKRELYDKTVYCPKCGSANVSVQYAQRARIPCQKYTLTFSSKTFLNHAFDSNFPIFATTSSGKWYPMLNVSWRAKTFSTLKTLVKKALKLHISSLR